MGKRLIGVWAAPMHQHPRILLGRDRELAETDAALAASASGRPRAFLVGGDAGIGKTSLVAELSGRARDRGFSVLTGHCLDIEAGVPLDPVCEALRGAVADRREETLPPVTRRLTPFLRGNAAPTEHARPTLFDDLRLAVAELTGEAPLVLVLEDMHWADRSTRDFALAQARTMQGPLLLVLTYRSEALTKHHPFRHALVEIGRSAGAQHLDLEPLDHAAISAIVRSRTGTEDPPLVEEVFARSEGNPLYAEELLASHGDGVPKHLEDLLLARIEALTPGARAMLRLASAHGSRIDPSLLALASGMATSDVDLCLREALEANVVTRTVGGLDFRHGLLREAAYGDLLPGERERAHVALADAVQAQFEPGDTQPSLEALGQLAYHRSAAGQPQQAFEAAVKAGVASRRYGAYEAIGYLERALELWDQVPDPETLGGIPKPDLLRLLADAAQGHGDLERADRYMAAALDALDRQSDPLLASRVYSTYADRYRQLPGRLDRKEALELAVTYAQGEPSEELAKALITRGLWNYTRAPYRPAVDLATQARDVAVAVGSPGEHTQALWLLGTSLFFLGHCGDGIGSLREAVEVASSAGLTGLELEMHAELAHRLIELGKTEEGIAVAKVGRTRANACGLPDAATFNGEQMAVALRNAGDLDAADRLLERLRLEGMHPFLWRAMRAEQLLARGDLASALPLERETIAGVGTDTVVYALGILRQVDLFSALGLVAEVLPLVDHYLADRVDIDSPLLLAIGARSALAALVAARTSGVTPPAGLSGRAADALQQVLGSMSQEWSTTIHAAHGLLAAAIAQNLQGSPAVSEWRAAEKSAVTHGNYFVLRPRLGLAGALLETGERDEARVLLLDLWQSARDMGAGQFEREAARIAHRNRIPLPEEEHLPRPLAVLTPREREVLDILATGATNRAIAERLFITEKTASVHVTNILAKLGVPNRGEAAALARELASES
jgi:DNA-binding CsgD family transcriptional regulator/tetratricopeptide (TPR) repeat protein